jgi:hypothetical protein
VRVGECVNGRKNSTMSKVILLFVCGCYERELRVIRGVFIPPILLKKKFLKKKQTERNGDKHTLICPIETLVCNCWTNDYTLDQLDASKSCAM